jgi:hypothetical protein
MALIKRSHDSSAEHSAQEPVQSSELIGMSTSGTPCRREESNGKKEEGFLV